MNKYIILISLMFLVVGCSEPQVINNEDTTTTKVFVNDEIKENPEIDDNFKEDIIYESDIAVHDNSQDCWIGFQGKVWDITDYVPKHPGGEGEIVPFCGTVGDFEMAFTKQHGSSKINILESEGMLIGNLE